MFRITGGKGFHITFANDYTVSVQFGPGNYCDHYDRNIGSDDEACGKEGSTVAEVAVWKNGSDLIEHPLYPNNTVGSRFTPEKVLELLNWAAEQP